MKNIALPLVCLLIGGAGGYGLCWIRGGAEKAPAQLTGGKSPNAESPQRSVESKNTANTSSPISVTPVSLGDQMKELLVDFDVKSAQKAASKLSASEVQAALALVAVMPPSSDRDLLRAALYRSWAALNPTAAWKAALSDPLDKNKGTMLAAVAGEMAKTNPTAAIDLAMGLGMGGRRAAVINKVFEGWSTLDVSAAIKYCNSHPDLAVDSFSFSRGLSKLAERDPQAAANLAVTFKDEFRRSSALTSLMNTWTEKDAASALAWAQSLSNPKLRQDSVAAVVGAWAKTDPAAALAHAQGIPDNETRVNAFKKAWSDWFRSSPTEAADYLANTNDEKLLQSVSFYVSYYSEGFTPSERASLLAKIPEGKGKEDILRTVTDSQIKKGQYNQALEMLNAMPDSHSRDRNVFQLGEQWALSDLKAATEWLKIQPDSTDRDLAVAGYANTLARTDPLAALEQIKSIPDEKVRESASKNIAVRWHKADATKAEAWMAGAAHLTENDKKFIRGMAAMRGDYVPSSVRVGTRR